MAKKQKAGTVDVGDFLAQNIAPQKPKGKKGGIPELVESKALADRAVAAYKAAKDASATLKAVEEEVLAVVAPEYERRGPTSEFTKSFNVVGATTPGVQITLKDQFETIPLERKPELVKALGDKLPLYFKEVRTLQLNNPDDETIKEALALLGPERFKRMFSIQVVLAATEDMDKRQWELPAEIRPKQAKASLKLIK